MLKTGFNRKFKKIIALSTLAAIGCSSNLIQSAEGEQDPVDIILSLTQEDREKLLELMRKQEIVEGLTDFKNFKHPVYFKKIKLEDGDEIDSTEDKATEMIEDWILGIISLESEKYKKSTKFFLLKNKSKNHIYLVPNNNEDEAKASGNLLVHYTKLKNTKYDPDKYEKKIWKKPNAFSDFCKNWQKKMMK